MRKVEPAFCISAHSPVVQSLKHGDMNFILSSLHLSLVSLFAYIVIHWWQLNVAMIQGVARRSGGMTDMHRGASLGMFADSLLFIL